MLLLQDSVILYDSLLVTFLLIFATMFLLTTQFCCKKKKDKGKKKKGGTSKAEPSGAAAPDAAQAQGTPPDEKKTEEKKSPEEGDKKKKPVSVKKGKGASDKGKGDSPAKALVTAMGPTTPPTATLANDQLKTIFSAQTMLQLQNISPGMIPVILPASQPGGTPTVMMMPAKDMQSVAAVTAQPLKQSTTVAPTPAPQKEPSLYEAIEVSKRSIGGEKKAVGKEKENSKRSNRETKPGMADQGSYQTLADIDTNKMFQKK
ncbi:hypothetical protein Mgra_00003246 [Meloidogyne graminicola]|uniref:Uncharacterized protein n=1 Tax=Meloidogyne graminicola TaxID=189291 RepID=A0A8S9ZVJ4_9BILA|nr:hypothetical protein Mgra_00003246 [Meloidogyne graminicola]